MPLIIPYVLFRLVTFEAAQANISQPPALVSALITETGVLTPSAVSEELISMWY